MRKIRFAKIGAVAMSLLLLQGTFLNFQDKFTATADAAVTQIPNTTRTFDSYNDSFMSLTGYAKGNVNERSAYYGTSSYVKVTDSTAFLKALNDASGGKIKVIEVAADLDLGYNALTSEGQKYAVKYKDPSTSITNPHIQKSGVSAVTLPRTEGLTIFSEKGNTITHAEFKINYGTNDIIIRNLNFDDMWQWDESGLHKEVGWTYFKVNGGNNVWIDHCSFSLGADGLIDIENGSKNVTLSWCEFGLPTDENPPKGSMMYDTIMYMESQYNAGKLSSSGRYTTLRKAGATPNMIMAYEAVHSKVHLLGGGDKDYKDDEIAQVPNGNQNFRLTLAYNHYTNIMQRVPLVRQGSAHLINNLIDDSGHANYANKYSSQFKRGGMTMYNAICARAGACIAADTCVFKSIKNPIICPEITSDDSLFNEPFKTLFSQMYNHVLIVNSKTSDTSGNQYTGSSWDNNGSNLFTAGVKWKDKSTIGKWAWSSYIVDVDKYSKQNYPGKDGSAVSPFKIGYNYDEKLPYEYQCLPLNDVETVIPQYSGAGKITMAAKDWLKLSYSDNGTIGTGTVKPTALLGDCNLDKAVTAADAKMLQEWLLRAGTITAWENADMNGDDKLDAFDLSLLKRKLLESGSIAYQLSVATESMEQVEVGTERAVQSITLQMDTSSDYKLHLNVGFWNAFVNIQCAGGKLTQTDDMKNIKQVSVSGSTVTITLADGISADNVTDKSNSTQMSYYGKVSFHHNSGNGSINIISYQITMGDTVAVKKPEENPTGTLVDMSELEGWAATAGYGRNSVTGGGDATPVYVDTLDEITAAAAGDTAKVIVVDGTITCGNSGIPVGSNTTIVGKDKNAAIKGAFYINGEQNIIISNLTMHGFYPNSGPDDCISARNVQHLWLNHLTLHDAGDGLMDITIGSDLVTVSWCKFYYTDLSNGHRLCCWNSSGTGHDEDIGKVNVTYHHNWFAEGVDQRMPRILYGKGHVYNNYYTATNNLYCVGVGSYASVLIESNYFKGSNSPHQFMYTHALPCYITAKNNKYDGTTGTKDTGLGGGTYGTVDAFTDPPYDYNVTNANDVPSVVQNSAGPR